MSAPTAPTPASTGLVGRVGGRLRRVAGGLLPHHLLLSAVFQKEMRVSGRKNSTFVTRAIYAILLVGLATLVFMGVRQGSQVQTGAAAIQSLQEIAPTVTTSILWFQMIFLPLIACMLAGPSICDEVRNRSLPALLTTPLSAAQIVFSKLSGVMVHITILALLSLPLLLGLRVFGGIDVWLVLGGAALTLTTALLAGSVGMLVSVHSKRSALAGSAAIGATVGLLFVPAPVIFLLMARGLVPQDVATNAVAIISGPINLGMVQVMASGQQVAPGLLPVGTLILGNVGYNVAASLVLLVLASMSFRSRLTGDRGEAVLGAPDKAGLFSRKQRRAMKRAAKAARLAAGPTPTAPGIASAPLAKAQAPARCATCGLDLSAFGADAPCPTCSAPAAGTPKAWVLPENRVVSDSPVLWRELRRQGARAASRRVGLPAALLMVALMGGLGAFLPTYGMVDGLSNASSSWSSSHRDATALSVATIGFAILMAGLAILTLFRAIKRVGLGQAIVAPSRGVLVFAVVVGVLLFAYWASDGDFQALHMAIGAIGQGLIFLRASTQNAGTLAEEREARTWETLLTTRLSPREIMLGKLAGSLARQWEIPALVLLHFAFAGVILDGLTPWVLVHVTATIVAGVAFLSGTGMLCALMITKGSLASLANAGIALGLWLVLPMCCGLLLMAAGADPDINQAVGTAVIGGQPLPLGMFAIAGAVENASYQGWGNPGDYEILDHQMSLMRFTLTLLGVSAAYVTAGALAMWAACARFNRRTGRTS